MELAIESIRISKGLRSTQRSLADQLLRSGTAPGALIAEAIDAESGRDKAHKFSIALKEARETEYWLELLSRAQLADEDTLRHSSDLVGEVIAMLIASIKTLRSQ